MADQDRSEAELKQAGYQAYLAEKQREAQLYQDVAELKTQVAALQNAVATMQQTLSQLADATRRRTA